MRELLLLRHAKSSWDDPGLRDHDRPLNPRGQRAAPRMAELLAAEEALPDRILSSTAVRATETAASIAAACGIEPLAVTTVEELYLAPPSVLLETARRHARGARRLLIVAHNPGMEELVSRLARSYEPFPTAGLARFALVIERWEQLDMDTRAELIGLWRPKELDP